MVVFYVKKKKKRKIIPLIIDIQDIFSTFNGWNKIRDKYYKTECYPMKIYETLVKSKLDIPEVKFIKDVAFGIKKKSASKKKILEFTCKIGKNNEEDNEEDNEDNEEDNDSEDENDDRKTELIF